MTPEQEARAIANGMTYILAYATSTDRKIQQTIEPLAEQLGFGSLDELILYLELIREKLKSELPEEQWMLYFENS